MDMTMLIYVCGLYSLAFALFHMGFWKMFKRESELGKLNFANNGIMQILNIQIIYYFLFVACICFIFPVELLTTKLGNFFLAVIVYFGLFVPFNNLFFYA